MKVSIFVYLLSLYFFSFCSSEQVQLLSVNYNVEFFSNADCSNKLFELLVNEAQCQSAVKSWILIQQIDSESVKQNSNLWGAVTQISFYSESTCSDLKETQAIRDLEERFCIPCYYCLGKPEIVYMKIAKEPLSSSSSSLHFNFLLMIIVIIFISIF